MLKTTFVLERDENQALLINLDSELQADTFKWMLDLGIKEIAGPGNEHVYAQMLVWRHLIQEGKS